MVHRGSSLQRRFGAAEVEEGRLRFSKGTLNDHLCLFIVILVHETIDIVILLLPSMPLLLIVQDALIV